MDKSKLELKADLYAMSVVGNLDLNTMIEGEIGITIALAYKQGYIDRDSEDVPFQTPTEFFSGCIPRIDAERKLGIIDYTYDPNRKPDWSAHLTALELEKYCKVFGIKLSETPSKEDYERAAKELSERFQKVTKDLFSKQEDV